MHPSFYFAAANRREAISAPYGRDFPLATLSGLLHGRAAVQGVRGELGWRNIHLASGSGGGGGKTPIYDSEAAIRESIKDESDEEP